ncbi:MAG TPA: hypothetical protein VFB22_14370 [Candidatus Baltobacteraceae bacterium]|nr:hypothetical protein [Candidatus Baltobacteraceae bacterium]
MSAALTATALAAPVQPVSIGQLVGNPNGWDGQNVSVTGTVMIRGDALWLQLCDGAMSCIYLDNAESARAKAGQTLTFYGKFLAHDTVRYTPINNVLVVAAS